MKYFVRFLNLSQIGNQTAVRGPLAQETFEWKPNEPTENWK